MSKLHVDLFGREIKVGDYIVYGAIDGRSGTLRAGQVVGLAIVHGYGKDTPKVRVKSWSNFRADPDRDRSGRQKDVTLSFVDRLIVVPKSIVSKEVLKDLANPAVDWTGKEIKGAA